MKPKQSHCKAALEQSTLLKALYTYEGDLTLCRFYIIYHRLIQLKI